METQFLRLSPLALATALALSRAETTVVAKLHAALSSSVTHARAHFADDGPAITRDQVAASRTSRPEIK